MSSRFSRPRSLFLKKTAIVVGGSAIVGLGLVRFNVINLPEKGPISASFRALSTALSGGNNSHIEANSNKEIENKNDFNKVKLAQDLKEKESYLSKVNKITSDIDAVSDQIHSCQKLINVKNGIVRPEPAVCRFPAPPIDLHAVSSDFLVNKIRVLTADLALTQANLDKCNKELAAVEAENIRNRGPRLEAYQKSFETVLSNENKVLECESKGVISEEIEKKRQSRKGSLGELHPQHLQSITDITPGLIESRTNLLINLNIKIGEDMKDCQQRSIASQGGGAN